MRKVADRTVRPGGQSMLGSLFIMQLLRDTRGATAIEYGLIVSLIVIAIIVAVQGVANETNGLWATVADNIEPAMGS